MSRTIEEVEISKIHAYEKNPRKNAGAVEKVAESIRAFGFQQPIICDAQGIIIAGHTRFKAAKRLGLKTVPVIYAADLSEDQARAYRLADNKVGELATWDADLLLSEIREIEGFDMTAFDFEISAYADSDAEVSGLLAEFNAIQVKRPEAIKHKEIVTTITLRGPSEVFTAELMAQIKSLYQYGIEIEVSSGKGSI